LIIETAFCNREKDSAIASKHLCPRLLAAELSKLTLKSEVYITHLKPGDTEVTMREIEACAKSWNPRRLENNQVYEL
jgi:hypothetical protein